MLDWPSDIQAVFDSDDDGDDTKASRRKGSNREFASLAKVDLTTPLRDDEVMPQRTHRVVPERKQKAEKKPKKSKKKSSKTQEPFGKTEDLLDLSGMYSESMPSLQLLPSTSTIPLSTHENPITSTFDDLLSMPVAPLSEIRMETFSMNQTMTTPSNLPQYSLASFNTPLSAHRPKRPWLRAALKTSNSDVSDWPSIAVLYQVVRSGDDINVGGHIRVKVDNRSGSVLVGVTLDVKDYGVIPFNNVSSMTSSSQSDKIGPFFSMHLIPQKN